jgi:uncharacterized protein
LKKNKYSKAAAFTILTFFVSWGLLGMYYIRGGRLDSPSTTIFLIGYMFIPAITAFVVQKYIYFQDIKEPLGISFKVNRWFLAAWLLPPLIAFATLGVNLLFPGIQFTPGMEGMLERFKDTITPAQMAEMKQQIATMPIHPIWLGFLQALVAGPTINAIAAFGEELGWRGILQRELEPMGFWRSSAIIGFIWGLWHAPIIIQGYNYPQHPVEGVFMMIAWCMLLTPIFCYVRRRAKSVIAAAIIHGSLNASVGLAIMVIKGGDDLTTGVLGLPGFIVLILVNIALFTFDRRQKKIVENPLTLQNPGGA